jgi:hypothetical protein
MSTTAEEIYAQVVLDLPLTERLRLANLILSDLVQQNVSFIDRSDTWTEQDKLDVAAFSLQYAATIFPESEEIAE